MPLTGLALDMEGSALQMLPTKLDMVQRPSVSLRACRLGGRAAGIERGMRARAALPTCVLPAHAAEMLTSSGRPVSQQAAAETSAIRGPHPMVHRLQQLMHGRSRALASQWIHGNRCMRPGPNRTLQMVHRLQPLMYGIELQSLVMSSVQSASLRAKVAHSAALGLV